MSHLSINKVAAIFATTLLLLFSTTGFCQKIKESKVYSDKEREAEESRIQREIENKLDWRNRTKESLDDYDDSHRLLYGTLNESILLRQTTCERFGIFESLETKTNKKRYEIRLHKKNKLIARFLSGSVYCESPALSADKVGKKFVLFREICFRNNRPNHTLYLYHYPSQALFWLYTNEVNYTKKPSVILQDGTYKVRWSGSIVGSNKPFNVIRNFKIHRTATGKWEAESLPPPSGRTR